MTHEERRQLETTAHKSTVACNLVQLINKGGQTSQQAFLTALRRSADEDSQSGHKELLEILQSRERKESDTTGQPRSPNISPQISYLDVSDSVFTYPIAQVQPLSPMHGSEPDAPLHFPVDTSVNESQEEV